MLRTRQAGRYALGVGTGCCAFAVPLRSDQDQISQYFGCIFIGRLENRRLSLSPAGAHLQATRQREGRRNQDAERA
jgi:hypothetical protein